MIQAKMGGTKSGREMVVYGLSRANMRLLLAGKPIHMDGSVLGLPHDTLIVGGETETDIANTLNGAFGKPRDAYTCCEKHAAEAGLPHRPAPPTMAPTACPPDAGDLPDV